VSKPDLRGKLIKDAPLAPYTWFRVGGPADTLYIPEDEADLCDFLRGLDPSVPVLPLGVGSNLLVRDGGIDGVVLRLMRGFSKIEVRGEHLYAGAAALDAMVAKAAAEAGLGGLEFFRGVPGTIGGAIFMNAGCYGAETKDILLEAYGVTRQGEAVTLSNAQMGYSYRHCAITDVIFTGALFKGTPDSVAAVTERMEAITQRRETTQPIREKTGGSTFKNPEGKSAWQCVDEAGFRGKLWGGAKFSELHANFMINADNATASDLESLGEAVRAEVKSHQGIELEWEIKRVGRV